MKKESAKRHHYIPRCYLKRFAYGKKKKLDVLVLDASGIEKRITPTVTTFFVECGVYDLSSLKQSASPALNDVPDSLLEEIFASVHESIFNNTLSESIDCNLSPSAEQSNRIAGSVLTFYLRNPRIRKINQEVAAEVASKIGDKQKNFVEDFAAFTTWSVIKLFPNAFRHTHCTLLHAVGTERFLTSDNPAIPCLFNYATGQIIRYDEKELQKSIVLADRWREEVALLFPLSPRWCIISQNIRNISEVSHVSLGSQEVEKINKFIRNAAQKYIVYPSK